MVTLDFYYQGIARIPAIMLYEYTTKKDERWFVDVIDKIDYTKPFDVYSFIFRNNLESVKISKSFESEKEMILFLLNEKYSRYQNTHSSFECYTKTLTSASRVEVNKINLLAIWKKII